MLSGRNMSDKQIMFTAVNTVYGQFKAGKNLLHFIFQAACGIKAAGACHGSQGLLTVENVSGEGDGLCSGAGGIFGNKDDRGEGALD